MELFFLKKLWAFANDGWAIRFTGKYDRYPALEYKCPFCGKEEAWISGGIAGFNGVAPVARCCANAVPYPVGKPEYLAHLTARPKWDNRREDKSPLVDTWDKVPSEYSCDAHRTKGLW
jgi:hypothetical protein